MTEWISKKVITFLVAKNIINKDPEIYLYGCEAILYTLISTAGLLVVSAICKQFVCGCVCISIFYLSQSFGGGFHANTHAKCFLTMTIGLLICFELSAFIYIHDMAMWIGIPSFAILLFIPLVLHPNLEYLQNQKDHLVYRSRMVTCIELVFFLILVLCQQYKLISVSAAAAITMSAISRIAGRVAYNGMHK